jgi:hypothetical protein
VDKAWEKELVRRAEADEREAVLDHLEMWRSAYANNGSPNVAVALELIAKSIKRGAHIYRRELQLVNGGK